MGERSTNNLIFIDETPFSLGIRRGRGRSKKGTRATINVKQVRAPSITAICAMHAERGLIYYETLTGATNGERFKQFLSNLLDLTLFETQSFILVMDNARIHMPEELKDMLAGRRVLHTLKFLPPYSPHVTTRISEATI